MYNLDKKDGNTGEMGRYFWRIENSTAKDALENCYTWENLQRNSGFRDWYILHIRNDVEMACPCTGRQARLDRRFDFDWTSYDWCYISRLSKVFKDFLVSQRCCYSSGLEDFGSLKVGAPDGGHVKVLPLYDVSKEVFTDEQAYKFCCVDIIEECDRFYLYRPSDDCLRYTPPRRRKFVF